MMRLFGMFIMLALLLGANEEFYVEHKVGKDVKKVLIKRAKPKECESVRMEIEDVFGGNLAGKHLHPSCKIEVATTPGRIQPMVIADGVQTIGELEVMEIMKESAKSPDKYMLVDARKVDWYEQMTIPSAINVQFTDLEYDPFLAQDYYGALTKLGISHKNGANLNFDKVKKIAVFCNGILCVQSKTFIKRLLDIGYPEDKIMWYRGGVQDWASVGLPVTRSAK